jgi:hypothetical protein
MVAAMTPALLLFSLACGSQKAIPLDTSATSDTAADEAGGDSAVDEAPPEDTGGPDSPPIDTGRGDTGVDGEGGETGGDAGGDTAAGDTGPEVSAYELCFEDISHDKDAAAPDYDQFDPIIGEHCSGTNHQDIVGVERVVFLGDSVTVGTPPTSPDDFYRSLLAEQLSDAFDLESPSESWEWYNVFDGTALVQSSGDFWSCAEWGARTDDLYRDNDQILDCFPEDERDRTTLVVMTIGGNDLNSLTQGFNEGRSHDELWDETFEYMALMREAVEFLKNPGNALGEVYVIFTNLYEYTDGTGDVESCWAAELAGYESITDPALEEMVIWSMEEFMSIAVDTDTDMLFLLEAFCGHGFNYDDATGRCYRGSDAELWFDLTCIHPNEKGHQAISEMFYDVVME